jgi:hypothetical protein
LREIVRGSTPRGRQRLLCILMGFSNPVRPDRHIASP